MDEYFGVAKNVGVTREEIEAVQSSQISDRSTQKTPSVFFRRGRSTERSRTTICCRSARFSGADLRWVARTENRVGFPEGTPDSPANRT